MKSQESAPLQLNFVLGTAAELIKIYPVIHLAQKRGHHIRIVSTGQSGDNFLMQYRDFKLSESDLKGLFPKTKDLNRAVDALKWFFRALFISKSRIRKNLLMAERSYVLVHGDTLSTLVGAILGKRAGLPVVHIEAGLRSKSLFSPFPEEITRRLTSRFVSFHMAPDEKAANHLKRSKLGGKIISTQGNTLMDAVLLAASGPQAVSDEVPFAMVNIHRFENLNSQHRWQAILEIVVRASQRCRLIFIMHPQTRYKLEQDPKTHAMLTSENIELRDRMPFSAFIGLLKKSEFLITDGGSNQEECSYLGKPCLILRDKTERQEGLDGCCVLSCFDESVIDNFLQSPETFQTKPLQQEQSPSGLILDSLNSLRNN